MQDTIFYGSAIIASLLLAQVPEVSEFKELSATVILGILFWYTLTRINASIGKLTETIMKLDKTISEHSEDGDVKED